MNGWFMRGMPGSVPTWRFGSMRTPGDRWCIAVTRDRSHVRSITKAPRFTAVLTRLLTHDAVASTLVLHSAWERAHAVIDLKVPISGGFTSGSSPEGLRRVHVHGS